MSSPATQAPDPTSMRAVLGHFATGVTIVTAATDEGPVGMAVNSFTSVSLEPPLVLFCAATSSSTWPHIRRAGAWVVNILSADDAALCRRFASKDTDRFAGVDWTAGSSGAPVLDDALAFVDCRTEVEHDAGDHVVVVGRVVALGHAAQGDPLLFFRGGYGRFEPA